MADNITTTKRLLRPITDKIGISDHVRSAIVQARLTGERLKFTFKGRPTPSDAILLIGSGRSGTTWLSSIITACPGVQEIFEPLNPYWIEGVRLLTGWNDSITYNRLLYLRPDGHYPEWHTLLENIFTGRIRNYWTDYVRTSYFPDQFLIKLIRANLMIGYLYNKFRPRIIYVTRHPCAVVNSRMAREWQADTSDVLKQEELVADHLSAWVSKIEAEKDLLGAHSVWWAVENAVAQQQLALCPHLYITYEELCLEPIQSAIQILDWLGLEKPRSLRNVLLQPSRSSRDDISYQSNLERLALWQRELSTEDQGRILKWGERLGITTYNDHFLPASLQERDLHFA